MTQIATVTAVPRPGIAVVSVARQTACGHDCEHCAGCGAQGGTVTVQAKTEIAVSPGDQVELFSGKQVLGIAALVYLAPVVLFLLGYFLSGPLTEGLRYLCGGAGFVLGIGLAVLADRQARRRSAVTFTITRKL